MNKKEILDYVMNTPGNTNPSVLRSLLDKEDGGSSGGGNFVVTFTRSNGALVGDKTWGEIWDAASSGNAVVLIYSDSYGDHVEQAAITRSENNGEYQYAFNEYREGSVVVYFYPGTVDGYPTEDLG